MEEVRTSESLEKEILDDARKKAERILKGSEKQAAEVKAEWDRKIEKELSLLNEEYQRRMRTSEREVKASLPLEKKRRKLRYLDERFEEFLAVFGGTLKEKELETLLAGRLAKAAPHLRNKSLKIRYAGISEETASRIIEEGLGSPLAEKEPSKGFVGLLLESEDGGIRYRLTLEEILNFLRVYNRRPIIAVLVKGIDNP